MGELTAMNVERKQKQFQEHVRSCEMCEAEALTGLTEDHIIRSNQLCLKGRRLFESIPKQPKFIKENSGSNRQERRSHIYRNKYGNA